MTRTSWSRSSDPAGLARLGGLATVVLATLLLCAAVAVPAAAVTVAEEDVTDEAAAGSKVTATVRLDALYQDPQLEQWTLAGETELVDVTWTVTLFDQTGAKVSQESYDGQEFSNASVAAADGTAEVEVRVTGTVPEVTEYRYDPPQRFTLMELDQTRTGGSSNEIGAWETHHYTDESRNARQAIDAAAAAIENAGGADTSEAEQTMGNAVSAFENGNFELATELGNEAESQASQARQSSRTMRLALYGVGALLVVGLAVGGFVYYRSQQDTYDKLG